MNRRDILIGAAASLTAAAGPSFGAEPLKAAIAHAIGLSGTALTQLGAALALIAAIDVPWQLHQNTQRLRMSRHPFNSQTSGR